MSLSNITDAQGLLQIDASRIRVPGPNGFSDGITIDSKGISPAQGVTTGSFSNVDYTSSAWASGTTGVVVPYVVYGNLITLTFPAFDQVQNGTPGTISIDIPSFPVNLRPARTSAVVIPFEYDSNPVVAEMIILTDGTITIVQTGGSSFSFPAATGLLGFTTDISLTYSIV